MKINLVTFIICHKLFYEPTLIKYKFYVFLHDSIKFINRDLVLDFEYRNDIRS